MADFTELREDKDRIKESDLSYTKVLKEIGIATEEEVENTPINVLPLFLCLIDMDDIHAISPLTKSGSIGYCQIEFKDGARSYCKIPWESLVSCFAAIATIHIPVDE